MPRRDLITSPSGVRGARMPRKKEWVTEDEVVEEEEEEEEAVLTEAVIEEVEEELATLSKKASALEDPLANSPIPEEVEAEASVEEAMIVVLAEEEEESAMLSKRASALEDPTADSVTIKLVLKNKLKIRYIGRNKIRIVGSSSSSSSG